MSSMSNVAELSKYILTLPKYKTTGTVIIIISIIYGVLLSIIRNTGAFTFKNIIYGGTFGFVVCGLSALIVGGTNQKWVDYFNGINLKLKHSMFLSLTCMCFLIIMSLIGCLVGNLIKIDLSMNSFILGCSLIFGFSLLVLRGVTQIKLRQAVFISFIQPFITFLLLIIFNNMSIKFELGVLGTLFKLIVACLIFTISLYFFIKIAEAPMKNNLNISVLKLLSFFVAHMNEDLLLIEKLFESIGEEIKTLIGIISFKRKNGDEKALFLSPYIHPGPLGEIGGANMPTLLANRFNQFTMVAHGPSTHDFNPVSIKEIDKIEDVVKKGLSEIEYSEKGSEFKRYSYKKANIGVQFFKKGMLMLSTFAPSGSDDIDFSVGLSVMIESEKIHKTKNNIFIDCHNSFNAEKGGVLPGNPEVFELLETVKKIEKKDLEYSIKVGCNQNNCEGLTKENGIGDSKLKTMVIEVNNQKTALLLFDSNNMELGFREKIFKEVKKWSLVDELEVMTTDTHSVNTLSNGYNPVGITEKEKILKYIKKSIELAIEDLEEVEVGTKLEKIRIKAMGPGKYNELISTISSTATITKITFPLTFLLSMALTLIWIFGVHIVII